MLFRSIPHSILFYLSLYPTLYFILSFSLSHTLFYLSLYPTLYFILSFSLSHTLFYFIFHSIPHSILFYLSLYPTLYFILSFSLSHTRFSCFFCRTHPHFSFPPMLNFFILFPPYIAAAGFLDDKYLKRPEDVLKAVSILLANELCLEPSLRSAAKVISLLNYLYLQK